MNALLRTLCYLLLGTSLAAAEPRAGFRIVVLDNENLLEGEVDRVAEGYEVRRPTGGDVTVPARRVLAVVPDRPAAFAVVAERANRRDADERLRLARWCLINDLLPQALAEAETAARMRPGFRPAEQLANSLREMLARRPPVADPAVVQVRAQSPTAEPVIDVPAIEYNSESFPLFATKVHPILLNACASCHAQPEAKGFRLTRLGGRPGMTRNLMAALAQVNPTDPASSPILVKAVTPHGTASEAPFKTRTHPAYQALEQWVRFARSPDGTLGPDRTPEPGRLPDLTPGKSTTGDAFGQDVPTGEPSPGTARPEDPFDPAIFNNPKR